MTRFLKYIIGLFILIIATICALFVLLNDKEQEVTLYKTKTGTGRVIFYKRVEDKFYTVDRNEIEELLKKSNVELVEKWSFGRNFTVVIIST